MDPHESTPLGAARARGARRTLVGREREQRELRERLAAVQRGAGGLVLVRGELGIGKSRLVEEIGAVAGAEGILVLAGHAWDGVGVRAYWPWVQVLRAWISAKPADDRGEAVAAEIRTLLAEIDDPARCRPVANDGPGAEDFALCDAVAGVLRRAARARPLVVILEDLHAADLPSLRLLRFAVRELRDAAVLFVGTHRVRDVRRAPEITDALAHLSADATNLLLDGLDRSGVASLAEATLGRPVSIELAAELHGATGGNPLFVEELAALLRVRSEDESLRALATGGLPPRLREIARRRLEPLTPGCQDLLAVAAMIGNEFSVTLLERVSGLQPHQVLEHLHEAHDDGVLQAVPGAPGRRRFAHDLLRESLCASFGAARSAELHRRVGHAMEELASADPTSHFSDLAHHFSRASPGGDRDRAIDYHERAGDRAVALADYEGAVVHLGQALRLLAPDSATAARRGALLLKRGEAQHRAGDAAGAREGLAAAVALARRIGDAELLAQAALAIGIQPHPAHVDEEMVALLEEALARLAPADSATRSRLLARLSQELFWSEHAERRHALDAEAVAMARRIGDPQALAYTLCCRRHLLWGSPDLEQRLAIAREAVALAERARDPELEADARQWLVTDLLELGDRASLERELTAHARRTARLPKAYAFFEHTGRALIALLDGRFQDAEQFAKGAAASARGADRENADRALYAQLFVVLREQGRIGPLLDASRDRGRSDVYFASHQPALRCGLALALADLEDTVAVRRELRDIVEGGFLHELHDEAYVAGLCALAEACAWAGDVEVAEMLAPRLLPHRGHNAVLGRALACFGPVSRYLGLLAATAGRSDDASQCFAEALAGANRLASPPLRARVLLDWAAASARRSGRDPEVRRMAEDALEIASALGMELVAERARQLLAGQAPASADFTVSSMAPDPVAIGGSIRRDGELWVIEFARELARFEDSRGLHYLAELLAEPGRERHALELAAGSSDPSMTSARAALGDAGPVLDPAAKAAYRDRLRELRDELDEAEANHDRGTAERASAEIDFLTAELARALGLGRRDRRGVSAAERARLNVTRALRRAIVRISGDCPQLGRHLQRCVRTGVFCVYESDDPVHWTVERR
jgi:hypothetical protein